MGMAFTFWILLCALEESKSFKSAKWAYGTSNENAKAIIDGNDLKEGGRGMEYSQGDDFYALSITGNPLKVLSEHFR